MAKRTKEIRQRVREALEREGAEQLQFSVLNNSHQRYNFQVGGRQGWFTFASTPRSSQAVLNAAKAAQRAVRKYREPLMPQRIAAEPGSQLARLRQEAHRALDVYWELGGITRSEAYAWLADKMGCSPRLCHIGLFDEQECERAIAICRSSAP